MFVICFVVSVTHMAVVVDTAVTALFVARVYINIMLPILDNMIQQYSVID